MKKLILSAAFVAFGTFAMAQQTGKMQKDPAQMEQKRAEKLKMMQADLGLSDAQVAQIKALQDKKKAERKAMAPQMQAERKAKMEQWKAKKAQHEAEMKQILTPDQFQKWQAKKQENMQKRGKMMKDMQMKRTQVQ
ncbi:hypothetical protein MTP09_02805 [Chryseobacterium suipulveris]|uniref:DUF4890 domain-containing protein n=1 Tax=Chryseobacterium suipulveris TaxID=2929800 RepID=A0ABY4BQV5_9FLAO|nr:hypothetical protein [Chryseobacterium suipulveris]UOE41587.1 hypothetical protein MTP09_02805 [Chryseobacterium suipulveris]